ncbi:hypothetical protein CDCA_CDCA03G1005 [Cyanidium caldarium]|uniref:DUF1517 domain-containing protein n=1 Tax=Cyanidium caldarium TaxID=2771 RepID=A0AAV9IRQ1_CYACA|nr:hypothetical protein CDCA_CDCA03G1005 [Cyanidium caldarium]
MFPVAFTVPLRVGVAHGLTLGRRTPLCVQRRISVARRGAVNMCDGARASPSEEERRTRAVPPLLRQGLGVLAALVLATAPLLADVAPADAAQGGGRMGGSSFRSMPRSAPRSFAPPSAPRSYFYSPAPVMPITPFYFGPVVMPFGFTGLGTLLFAAAFFAFASRALSSVGAVTGLGGGPDDTVDVEKVTVTKMKVGLLSTARELQRELEEIAYRGNTNSVEGLQQILQETTLSLYRNPEYWSYGSLSTKTVAQERAEEAFTKETFTERSKLERETLANVAGRIRENKARRGAGDVFPTSRVGQYIVVTLVVASTGRLSDMPKQIRSTRDIETALRILGSVPHEALQGVEVIWSPQSFDDVLTEEELLTDHPELMRL